MSSEYWAHPSDSFEEDHNTADTRSVIDEIYLELMEKLEIIEEMLEECTDHDEHIALYARGDQLTKLGESVIMMAQYEKLDESILLDDPVEQMLYDYEGVDAYEVGIRVGTDDVMETLAPNSFQDVYFLPWHLGLFIQMHDIEILDNNAASSSLSTRIPNVEVNYYFPSDSNVPKRALYFRSE